MALADLNAHLFSKNPAATAAVLGAALLAAKLTITYFASPVSRLVSDHTKIATQVNDETYVSLGGEELEYDVIIIGGGELLTSRVRYGSSCDGFQVLLAVSSLLVFPKTRTFVF